MEKYNELINDKLKLEEDIANIQFQLKKAKAKCEASGVIDNTDWYNKAKHALNMKAIELKKVNSEFEIYKRNMKIDKKNKQSERDKLLGQIFIDICRVELPKEEYLRIMNIALTKLFILTKDES